METEKLGLARVESEEEKERRLEREKKEHDDSVDVGAHWILSVLQKNEAYSERIPLKRDRTFDIPEDITELPGNVAQLVRSARQMEYSQKGLYDLIKEIREKHPELQFSFKLDRDGKWIEYSVKKQNLNIGDKVIWESDGSLQWKDPKKIQSIQEDPTSKRKYAFIEGETTGIPLDELVLNNERELRA